MSDRSAIEWTDATWNPIRGCSRVSEGCRHCYAERVAARFSGPGLPYEGLARMSAGGEPRWTGEVRVVKEQLDAPLRWREPRRIFVNSMSDLFHEKVSDRFIGAAFAIMALAKQHTFQILTKRPARMRELVSWMTDTLPARWWMEEAILAELGHDPSGCGLVPTPSLPLPNVWLGVSCEDQAAADERVPLLLETPAAVRFVSAEPLLGPMDLRSYLHDSNCIWRECTGSATWCSCSVPREGCLDWVIAGGESGPGARPMHLNWVRSIRDQCAAAHVPFFFKQWGGPRPKSRGRDLDGRTWDEFPEAKK